MPRRQCGKCPWKVSTDPRNIPHGYCETKHHNLKDTIAPPGELRLKGLRVMACHESKIGAEFACVGWLANQLGPGNNLGLRLMAYKKPELFDFELVGDQHERFEDTLPRRRKARR